jgi:hypothetical protein
LYWRPEIEAAVPNEITFDISGCTKEDGNDGCKLDQFIERSKPYQMLPTPKEAADFFNIKYFVTLIKLHFKNIKKLKFL